MTLLRGIADDIPLMEWLERHIWPAEKEHMNREIVRLGTELATAEQLLAGVTTTTDMYFFGDEVCAVLAEAGGKPEHIVRLTWYVTDKKTYLAHQREVGEVYRRVLGRHFPAMTMVVVSALVEDEALVEIEATAKLSVPG